MRLRWAEDGRRLTRENRQDIERRVAAGESFELIAKETRCSLKSIQRVLARSGGVRRVPRERSPLRLSRADREELSRGLVAGDSLRQIAARLGRAPSTISREVVHNGARENYRGWRGEKSAAKRASRPKPCKLRTNSRLRQEVECGLLNAWSPQQISMSLVREHPDDLEMRVSHETIYRSLFVQARGALRKELTAHLRTQRTQRRARKRTALSGTGRIQDAISISARPAEASDRAVPGHWEGDLIIGEGGRSAIGTLVERRSRYVMLVHLPGGRTAEEFRIALTRQFSSLPAELRRSVTWDQGKEMAEHVKFTVESKIAVYFCDPHSPWQRGSNENTNGLLRQYFPKGTDLSVHSRATLKAVAAQLNGRPRQTLGWMKPSEVFGLTVASTG